MPKALKPLKTDEATTPAVAPNDEPQVTLEAPVIPVADVAPVAERPVPAGWTRTSRGLLRKDC